MSMGSNEADKPLRRINASFEQLAAVAKQQQQPAMAAGDFSRACSNVFVIFGFLGITFKFAEMDYISKRQPDGCRTPNHRRAVAAGWMWFPLLQEVGVGEPSGLARARPWRSS